MLTICGTTPTLTKADLQNQCSTDYCVVTPTPCDQGGGNTVRPKLRTHPPLLLRNQRPRSCLHLLQRRTTITHIPRSIRQQKRRRLHLRHFNQMGVHTPRLGRGQQLGSLLRNPNSSSIDTLTWGYNNINCFVTPFHQFYKNMKIVTKKIITIIAIVTASVIIFFLIKEKPNQYFDPQNSNNTYIITADDNYFYVSFHSNGEDSQKSFKSIISSSPVELHQFLDKKVKLNGEFINTTFDQVLCPKENCKNRNLPLQALEITDISLAE